MSSGDNGFGYHHSISFTFREGRSGIIPLSWCNSHERRGAYREQKERRPAPGLPDNLPNGYLETIEKGLAAVRTFRDGLSYGVGKREENLARLKAELETADTVVIGAGAGLSTSAGLTYSGERFERYFFDFIRAFRVPDMYTGGFYPFPDEETRWAWWARHIYYNRYIDPPKPVYRDLLRLVRDKDYFVVTTNVDHQFQRAGFDKTRLFYTQGDYGLFQSADHSIRRTYDNEEWVMEAMAAQTEVPDWLRGVVRQDEIWTIATMNKGQTPLLIAGDGARNKFMVLPGGGYITIEIKLPDQWDDLIAPMGYEPLSCFEISDSD